MKLTYALPLAHNIITIDNIEASEYSLLAAIQWKALLSLAIRCKISNQKTKYATQTVRYNWGTHINDDKLC